MTPALAMSDKIIDVTLIIVYVSFNVHSNRSPVLSRPLRIKLGFADVWYYIVGHNNK